MYRQMFTAFKNARDSVSNDGSSISDIAVAKANMIECNKKMGESESSDPLKEYLKRTSEVHLHKRFTVWVSALKEKDPNWKFWANFVFCDMLSYFCLFLSMRSGIWKLRLSGIKSMATLWHLIIHIIERPCQDA